jgi:uncharacterized protein (UPF0333 family)
MMMCDFMNKKGQVSMEFMVSVLAVLLVFIFCMGIFAERSNMNISSNQKWSSENIVSTFSRNVNNVSLMDNNSTICDYIYWNKPNQTIYLSENTLQVFFNDVYADSPFTTKNIIWNITDINGLICFSKRNNFVYVEYP